MKCPTCGEETRHNGTMSTLVGFVPFKDEHGNVHHHDDNCLRRYYVCINDHSWVESIIRTCDVEGCDWKGKDECGCHEGKKVEKWSDPDDYYSDEYLELIKQVKSLKGELINPFQ